MPREEDILNEIAKLQAEIGKLHTKLDRVHTHQQVRHGWMKHLLHDLEYNPRTQYRVHITASYFWLINLVVVFVIQAVFTDFWAQIAVLYVAVVSLYANFATDYGAASAALAAGGGEPLPELPGEPKT